MSLTVQIVLFAKMKQKTIEHLFWNCEYVQTFIDEIDLFLSNGISVPFTISHFRG